jgi:hypothetical protein
LKREDTSDGDIVENRHAYELPAERRSEVRTKTDALYLDVNEIIAQKYCLHNQATLLA